MDRPLPNILEKIRATKLAEIEALLKETSIRELELSAAARLQSDPVRPFEKNVTRPGTVPNVIAEVKKASPSKGLIREDFNPERIASAYNKGGAAAISCLTDREFFQGKLEYIQTVRGASTLPVLRKDFIIDPAQVLEACAAGADAILLIARMLESEDLSRLYRMAKGFGMGVLMEIHDEADMEKAMEVGATLLGVNNRDLDTFVVDIETVFRLREKITAEVPLVAESGISSHEQLLKLSENNICAVLVGEHLMRQPDVTIALKNLRGA
ncbi:MAG: indole-3-glycerol phosphate synthase TrpC [Planctomycetes bacterium]|nr:indole-3-glycerol phosphate synthase TrpC [Planctomycetota bacterium]